MQHGELRHWKGLRKVISHDFSKHQGGNPMSAGSYSFNQPLKEFMEHLSPWLHLFGVPYSQRHILNEWQILGRTVSTYFLTSKPFCTIYCIHTLHAIVHYDHYVWSTLIQHALKYPQWFQCSLIVVTTQRKDVQSVRWWVRHTDQIRLKRFSWCICLSASRPCIEIGTSPISPEKTHKNCYETPRNSITAAVAGVDGGTIDMLVGHQASMCHGTENFGSLHCVTSWENTNWGVEISVRAIYIQYLYLK